MHRIEWNSGSELQNILQRAAKTGNFPEGTEKCKIPGKILDIEVENWNDHGCSNFRDLKQKKDCGISQVTDSNTRPHFTVQRAKTFGS